MTRMKLIPRFALVLVLIAPAVASIVMNQSASAQAPVTPAIEPLHFHHVHLNSMDPKAAADYYPKPFAKSATRTTFNGFEAVKTGNIYILFTKVNTPPTNELTGPQTSVWHFGWNTPNSREYNANFRKMGLTIAQMWNGSDADAKLVDLSGDVPTPRAAASRHKNRFSNYARKARRSIRRSRRVASDICADLTA